MSSEFSIREAVKSDRDGVIAIIEATDNLSTDEKDCAVELLDMYLVELNEATPDECGDASKDSHGDTCCETEEDYLLLVAVSEDETPAGYICYGPASFAGGVSEIYWIVVGEGFKKRGVASSLVEHVEGILKETELRMLVAETSGTDHYEAARGFYKKMGFIEEARIEGFFKDGDDKVFFVKRY